MNMKSRITVFIAILVSASAVQAEGVVSTDETALVVPAFSWAGFYFGGQVGKDFSEVKRIQEKSDNNLPNHWLEQNLPEHLKKYNLRKLSGFVGGLYAGYNFDVGGAFVLGIETDAVLSGKSNKTEDDFCIGEGEITLLKELYPNIKVENGNHLTEKVTLKENWGGATRLRAGFSLGRMMPYVAGGIAYVQIQDTASISIKEKRDEEKEIASVLVSDKIETMIGYTLGAGLAFAATDNIIVRGEYRYSDFGATEFLQGALIVDAAKFSYKTNAFRLGIAYKF